MEFQNLLTNCLYDLKIIQKGVNHVCRAINFHKTHYMMGLDDKNDEGFMLMYVFTHHSHIRREMGIGI